MAYNAYASAGPPPKPGDGQLGSSIGLYGPTQGHWLREAGQNDSSDRSWEAIEKARERLLENVVKTHDRESVNEFKRAQETVAEAAESPNLGKMLAAKKPEAKSDDKRKKLLSSMICVKGRERPTDAESPESASKKAKTHESSAQEVGAGGGGGERHLGDAVEAKVQDPQQAATVALSAFADYSDSEEEEEEKAAAPPPKKKLPSARDALNESTPSFLKAAAATVKARGEAAERVKEEGLEK